jgi:hypothetical protein
MYVIQGSDIFQFDALGALSVYLVTLLALSGLVLPGTAALVITSAMTFTSSIYWTCRAWTQVELDLKCVALLSHENLSQ